MAHEHALLVQQARQAEDSGGEYFIDDIRLQTPGFRVGGPILQNKAFYFGNVEWFSWPNSASRIRYFLKQDAAQGLFRYKDNSGVTQTLNLLSLAASKGQTSTVDPTLAKLFADIRTAAATEGGIDSSAELNLEKYSYSPTGSQSRYFPTARVDYNLTPAHRLSGVFRWNHFGGLPDVLNNNEPAFPGFPNQGGQGSERWFVQGSLRSTFGKNLVNEFIVGKADATGQGTYFSVGVNDGMFNCDGLGGQSLAGKGYAFQVSTSTVGSVNLTNPYVSFSPSADVAATLNFDNTLTWLKATRSAWVGPTRTSNGAAGRITSSMRGSISASTAGTRPLRCSTPRQGTFRAGSTRRSRVTLASCTPWSLGVSARSSATTSGTARPTTSTAKGEAA